MQIRDETLLKFQEIWFKEYLLSLRENCLVLHETNYLEKIKNDDVVLIKTLSIPDRIGNLGE